MFLKNENFFCWGLPMVNGQSSMVNKKKGDRCRPIKYT